MKKRSKPAAKGIVTLPAVEIVARMVDTSQIEPLAVSPEVAAHLLESPNARGWMRLVELLREAARDPVIAASPGATGFLYVAITMSEDSLSDTIGTRAIEELDEFLPHGALGVKSRTAHKASGVGNAKLTPEQKASIQRTLADHERNGTTYGAIKALSKQLGVNESTIRRAAGRKKT